ncbi:hypothetical protein CF326_g9221 [Tilletia indica]|nr:hypothetical protein CF326_g9221 [Tilletia indica]
MRFALTASLSLIAFSVLGFTTANPQELASRQAPNTIYSDYPLQQTAAINVTAWLVPITKTQASKLAGGRTLLPPKGLPAGFSLKEDQHLMLMYVLQTSPFSLIGLDAEQFSILILAVSRAITRMYASSTSSASRS